MRIGSLFSGIGGLELGLEWAGLGPTAWQVEIDQFCRRVLEWHWPRAERFTDVREVGKHNLAPVDVLCGGFPCQDVSSAGKGAGIKEGTRSGLWIEYARIIHELSPPWVVVENVASGTRRWLPRVRRDLHVLGYASTAVSLSAADVGAPHLRRRIFVVAHPYRDVLREQSRRRERAYWASEAVPGQPRSEGLVTDADRNGESALSEYAEVGGASELAADARTQGREGPRPHTHEGWCRSASGAWGPPLGGLVPVVHGLPGGVVGRRRRERIRALGNSVVPQCAEVIGRMIAEVA
jgi:DNA-cytosine methyltransferase